METALISVIKDRTEGLLNNLERVIHTARPDFVLCGMPVWRHIYHTLYWFDYWFAGPQLFCGADFHTDHLESLDMPHRQQVTQEQLAAYQSRIAEKTRRYLKELTDDALSACPPGCDKTCLELILGQFRHAYCHIGNINATTILETGEWPYVAIGQFDSQKGYYE